VVLVAALPKRKQTEVTELKFTTASHQIRVHQEADGEVTYVGVSKLQESSAEDLRKLLELISPDVSRDDWLRVGNFLKHQTHLDGFELWSQWSRRSDQCSTKLPYEWRMLGGGGRPCTLGTLIFLARKDHDDAVAQWQRETGGDEPEVARTKEALDYAGVMEWNKHCIYIEATHSYLWLSGGDAPVPITKDHGILNFNYYLSVPRFVQVKSTGALSFVAQPKFYLVSSSPRVRPLRMLSEPARGFSVRTSHTHRVSIPPL
jgi:hypothetical protein